MVVFEHGMVFGILGAATVLIMLARWLAFGEAARGRQLIIATLGVGAFLAVNWTVNTPREQIVAQCQKLARIVDEGDVAALKRELAESFESEGLSRDQFAEQAASILTSVRVDHVRLFDFEIELNDQSHALVTFGCTCSVRMSEGFAGSVPTRWRLKFVRNGNEWLVNEVTPIPVPPLHIRSLDRSTFRSSGDQPDSSRRSHFIEITISRANCHIG